MTTDSQTDTTSPRTPLTYASYLRVDELLALQTPLSDGPEHDETLFIIIHQVYELWFKQILHEVDRLDASLDADDVPVALVALKRVLTIFKTLVGQVDILETMSPLSFNSFRTRLDSSSGFQSVQFRTLEFRLGARSRGRLGVHPEGSAVRSTLEALLTTESTYDRFLRFMDRAGFSMPPELATRERGGGNFEHDGARRQLVTVYRTRPDLAQVCERLVDLDEGLQEWRYRHVKMVERTIGMKSGTGGSSGAEYLRATLFRPLFPDLWAIRNEF
ncbi:MAG: tryptophan 2,3-dioxygenase [Myxococcales bacterium]|nr:tryptophan 2,3-dioxygenase [Myxococcales bacterium]